MNKGHSKTDPDNPGWTVGWGITGNCDLACSFCYSSSFRKPGHEDTTLSEAGQFLLNNASIIRAFNFGTGESFLAPEFPDLLDLCEELVPNARRSVTTNGSFVALPSHVQTQLTALLSECDISIDFAQESAHDTWRGKAGTWSRAVRTAETMQDNGCVSSLVMVGTRETLDKTNLKGLLRLARSLGAVLRINMFMPTAGEFSFAPSLETAWYVIDLLRHECQHVVSSDRLFGSITGNPFPRSPNRSCRILPGGSVSTSPYLISDPWLVTCPLEELRLDTLNQQAPFELSENAPIPVSCSGCGFVDTCRGGSIERRWLWHKNLHLPDPLCPWQNTIKRRVKSEVNPTVTPDSITLPTIHLDYLPTIVAVP